MARDFLDAYPEVNQQNETERLIVLYGRCCYYSRLCEVALVASESDQTRGIKHDQIWLLKMFLKTNVGRLATDVPTGTNWHHDHPNIYE